MKNLGYIFPSNILLIRMMMRFVLVFVVCFGMALGGEIQRSEHWISGSSHSSLQTVCTGNTPTLCGSTCCQYSPCTTSNTCPSCPGSDTVCQGAGTTYNAPPVCCPTSTSRCYVKLGYNTCQKICSSSESQCADGELCFDFSDIITTFCLSTYF